MPKFYVQSGSFRGVVVRENAQCAARWAVEFVMNQSKSLELEESREEIGLFRLSNTIGISQRGFDRKDRIRIATSDAVLDWMTSGVRGKR